MKKKIIILIAILACFSIVFTVFSFATKAATTNNSTKSAFSKIEAEDYSSVSSSAIKTFTTNSGKAIGYIENGNSVTYNNIDFGSGATSVSASVASTSNSNIQVRIGSASGTLLGTISNVSTGNWSTYQNKTASISNVTGKQNIVLVFSGAVNIDSFIFTTGTNNNTTNNTTTNNNNNNNNTSSNGKFHVFLLLGQSNMAGYPKAQSSDKVQDSRIQVLDYNTNTWRVATPPLHETYQGAIGPGDWFSKTIVNYVPKGDTIGLVPCAISGEKIETFMKNGGSKYSWIINRAKQAQQKGGVIDGILFHQGESNNGNQNWPSNVSTLVKDLKSDLGLGNVPFLAGELLYSGSCASHNTLVNKLPGLITNCSVISANGLVVDSSDSQWKLHFSHDSQVTFGKRYAEKMISALGWKKQQ